MKKAKPQHVGRTWKDIRKQFRRPRSDWTLHRAMRWFERFLDVPKYSFESTRAKGKAARRRTIGYLRTKTHESKVKSSH